MNMPGAGAPSGRVTSLHLHPAVGGEPMRSINSVEAVQDLGIREDQRYFGRRTRDAGQPSIRQVSLIEREQIMEHARALGLDAIPPGAVRANIETEGVGLVALVGKRLRIGNAVLLVREPRQPCAKMDAVCKGLRALMQEDRQGVLAQVVESGWIHEGDPIEILPDS